MPAMQGTEKVSSPADSELKAFTPESSSHPSSPVPDTPSALPEQPYDNPNGAKLAWHLTSTIVLVVWLAYICVLLWLLQRASDAENLAASRNRWWDVRLPSAMLTIFAQAHAPITAMHLSRLAVSALHDRRTSARSWAEVFWMADKRFGTPVGVLSTIREQQSLGLGTRISPTFLAFATTCLIAISTPIMLQRGWEASSVNIKYTYPIETNTFSEDTLGALSSWPQISLGGALWQTSLPQADMYTSNDSSAIFVSGQFQDYVVNDLLGVRVESHCVPTDVPVDMPKSANASMDEWQGWCEKTFPDHQYLFGADYSSSYATIDWWYCSNENLDNPWLNSEENSEITAYLPFWMTNSTQRSEELLMVQCTSSLYMGNATVDGRNNGFKVDSFHAATYKPKYQTSLNHPLNAAITNLGLPVNGSGTGMEDIAEARSHSMLTMLGFKINTSDPSQSTQYGQPTVDELAAQLNMGVLSMGIAIGVLGRKDDVKVPNVTTFDRVPGFERDPPFIYASLGLLSAWLVLMILLSARMLRATFAPSLGSYSASRLLANDPDLVAGQPVGELVGNGRLARAFGRVGDTSPLDSPMGYVSPIQSPATGMPKLSARRVYGQA